MSEHNPMRLLIGTYSVPVLFGTGEVFCGKGKGIYACAFDGENLRVEQVLELGNPSYLTVNEKAGKIYAVNEMQEFQGQYGGGLTEIDLAADGSLRAVAAYPTGGTDPCHVAVSPDGRLLGVSNYSDGSVTFFALDAQGRLTGEKQHFQHQGHGLHPVRQTGPHAHSVLYDGAGHAFVADLGIDSLLCYEIREAQVKEDETRSLRLTPGSGPRFGSFSADGRHFYLVSELRSTVSHFTWDGERLQLREAVSSLPEDWAGDSICADLHITPDGRYLYATNRGHDSVVGYAIGEDGALRLLGHTPCRGKTPRNFAIAPDGSLLFVGNQDSDNIAIFRIEKDGSLVFMKIVDFPTPVCIQFLHT